LRLQNTFSRRQSFNRTTVECKYQPNSTEQTEPKSFNRTTVECKYRISDCDDWCRKRFNRTTVECKYDWFW